MLCYSSICVKMISQDIQRLIIKYLSRQATLLERNKLEVWLENYDNYKIFKEYVKINYLIDLNMGMFDADDSKKELLELIDKEKKQYRFRKYSKVIKYAAVFVGIIITTYFFKDNIFNRLVETNPIIVSKNANESGTDKAVLTLADGSNIELIKGETYTTKNAHSNGKEIVYNSASAKSEITYNYLTTPRGGQYFVKLSDGTQVWLNSESRLKYPITFQDGETRELELVYGEAYFDVSPSTKHNGAKFIVNNYAQEVEVLGTEFNIKAYKDDSSLLTTLVEGKVAVNVLNNTKFLAPNQQLKLDVINNSAVISEIDVYCEISWKNGVFSFKNKALKDIMKVLSRWYEIEVSFKDMSMENVVFNGTLKKNLSIVEIMETIANASGIDYEIDGKTIFFK